jgi:hypothetical protein
MQTLPLISIYINILLGCLVLWLFFDKYKDVYKKKKILREKQAKQRENLKKANFVKTIRVEVRRYLEELQNG